MAWVTGGRDPATFRRLYEKVKPLSNCIFSIDHWDACAKVLPPERPGIGTAHPVSIARDNSHTHHHRGRMPRRTKVVSTKACLVNASIQRWLALTPPPIFAQYQAKYLCTFM